MYIYICNAYHSIFLSAGDARGGGGRVLLHRLRCALPRPLHSPQPSSKIYYPVYHTIYH